jgi:hypothetical protein
LTATFSLNEREGNGLNDEYFGICADRDVSKRSIRLSDEISFDEIFVGFSRLRHVNNCSISFCKSSVSSLDEDLIETLVLN